MNRVPVISSNVVAVGYIESTHTLEIEFKHGLIYRYFQVPVSVYQGLISASARGESVGRFLDQNVKKAGYQYTKL
jgi:hypothetical protein